MSKNRKFKAAPYLGPFPAPGRLDGVTIILDGRSGETKILNEDGNPIPGVFAVEIVGSIAEATKAVLHVYPKSIQALGVKAVVEIDEEAGE